MHIGRRFWLMLLVALIALPLSGTLPRTTPRSSAGPSRTPHPQAPPPGNHDRPSRTDRHAPQPDLKAELPRELRAVPSAAPEPLLSHDTLLPPAPSPVSTRSPAPWPTASPATPAASPRASASATAAAGATPPTSAAPTGSPRAGSTRQHAAAGGVEHLAASAPSLTVGPAVDQSSLRCTAASISAGSPGSPQPLGASVSFTATAMTCPTPQYTLLHD
ncbi:MAG: hypothetical protein ACR2PL_24055 [Dehalococcoidia bacterium]